MKKTLSLRGLARLMGVDDKSVRKAMQAGVFSTAAVSRDEHGAPVVLNATLAVDEWQKSGRQLRGDRRATLAAPSIDSPALNQAADPRAELAALLGRARQIRQGLSGADGTAAETGESSEDPPAPPSGDTSPTLVRAQTDVALERGRALRMENDLREGSLVEADQAAREAFEFARTLRENLLNIPARLAAELAAESDESRVHRRLEDALRDALESTAATLDSAPPAPPGDRGSVMVSV